LYWPRTLGKQHNIFEVFNLPLIKAPTGQTLLTIHDIRRLRLKYGILERALFKMVLGRSLKAADHVVTVSEAMKEEILTFYPGTPISVIYNGLDIDEFNSVSEFDLVTVRHKYKLPQEFALAVGHLESRKNYLRLLDAIAYLRDRGRSCPLVIVGNDNGYREVIERKVASRKLSDCVKILSGLGDQELRCMYKLCSLFVFASSYEGFGIPILEAMAASRPMVLSDIPVFREITQDKGFYFCHNDIEAIAFAMEQVLSISSERARLVQYGNERVQSFGFRVLAEKVERVYQSMS
jgi:glycosyltransferase involved in cell wall biosynthesis